MRIILYLFFILFLPLSTAAQITYTGSITDVETKENIPYATVGLISENSGTNADNKGIFKLKAKKYPSDTLLISSAGYHSVRIDPDKYRHEMRIELKRTEKRMPVEITFDSIPETLNAFTSCGTHSYTSNGSYSQVAQRYSLQKVNAGLKEVIICKQAGTSIFRLRIYSMDPLSGAPLNNLSDSLIEIRSALKEVRINLEKYNIIIPDKNFFIAIEWLMIPLNQYKVKVKSSGQKIKDHYYSPEIFYGEKKKKMNETGSPNEQWLLSFAGKWYLSPVNMNFLVTARVLY